jgi:hypothetical protein
LDFLSQREKSLKIFFARLLKVQTPAAARPFIWRYPGRLVGFNLFRKRAKKLSTIDLKNLSQKNQKAFLAF